MTSCERVLRVLELELKADRGASFGAIGSLIRQLWGLRCSLDQQLKLSAFLARILYHHCIMTMYCRKESISLTVSFIPYGVEEALPFDVGHVLSGDSAQVGQQAVDHAQTSTFARQQPQTEEQRSLAIIQHKIFEQTTTLSMHHVLGSQSMPGRMGENCCTFSLLCQA